MLTDVFVVDVYKSRGEENKITNAHSEERVLFVYEMRLVRLFSKEVMYGFVLLCSKHKQLVTSDISRIAPTHMPSVMFDAVQTDDLFSSILLWTRAD